ncbi:MAG: sporulation protein [Methylophilaceae bacterium]
MKVLIWLLLLVNLGLAAYFNADTLLHSTPQIKWTELEPEKMHLLTEAEIKALPKMAIEKSTEVSVAEMPPASEVAPIATTACFEWGLFSESKLEKAKMAIAKLALNAEVKVQASKTPKRFWVYISPFESNQAALLHAAELKNLGVEDLYIVQEPKWKNAISFGLFGDEALAQKLLDELKAKGVQNIQKAEWNPSVQSSLIFNQLSESQVEVLRTIRASASSTKLKEISCQ